MLPWRWHCNGESQAEPKSHVPLAFKITAVRPEEMQDVAKTSFLAQKWANDFKTSHDFDSWGQLEEARESYEKLARNLTVELSSEQSLGWSDLDTENIEKLAICLVLLVAFHSMRFLGDTE